MKKILEVIKKVFCWLGAIFSAIFIVLFCKDSLVKPGNDKWSRRQNDDDAKEDADEINAKAAAKRDEAIARIERADARASCESYGSVCDAIADGKERFRRRVSTNSTTGRLADD